MPNVINQKEIKRLVNDYNNYELEDEKLFSKYALSNDFVRLPKSIDVQPLKVLGLILSKLDFKSDNSINGTVEVCCTLSEIRKACGVDHLNYEYYKQVVKDLIKSSYIEGTTIDGVDIMGYAVPYAKIIPNAEQITFTFKLFNDLMPYFQCLASHYTIIELEQTKKFKSRFSYNLYMNLLSWREFDVECMRFYTTKQIKELFGLEKDDYCRKSGKFDRTDFENKTIKRAIEEINQCTNLRVAWKKNKDNGKVVNYQFNFIEFKYD